MAWLSFLETCQTLLEQLRRRVGRLSVSPGQLFRIERGCRYNPLPNAWVLREVGAHRGSPAWGTGPEPSLLCSLGFVNLLVAAELCLAAPAGLMLQSPCPLPA